MTPEQIALVERSLARARPRLDDVAADLYRRLFELDPSVAGLFGRDPALQRSTFARHLELIVDSIDHVGELVERTAALGAAHRRFGASTAHYRHVGVALLAALAAALGPDWTDEVAQAWSLAYNLIAESMMAGAAATSAGIADG